MWRDDRNEVASLERALNFLERAQDRPGLPTAGAWHAEVEVAQRRRCAASATPRDVGSNRIDRTCFVTSLIATHLAPLISHPGVAVMIARAGGFIASCRADIHTPAIAGGFGAVGSYAFWSNLDPGRRALADLDDTALALTALARVDDGMRHVNELQSSIPMLRLSELDALRLFSAYRATAGCNLAQQSRWAAAYPGIFTTWIAPPSHGPDTPLVVDAGVNANVVRCLALSGNSHVCGCEPARRMLAEVISAALPVDLIAPYYRSRSLIVWLAAEAARGSGKDGLALARSVRSALTSLRPEPDQALGGGLLRASARAALGDDPELAPQLLAVTQESDGGWSASVVCSDFLGRTRWRSRALSTALAASLIHTSVKDQRHA
jgi:hypothetical protein